MSSMSFVPAKLSAGTVNGAAINWEKYHRSRFILAFGAFDVGASLDCKVQESDDAAAWVDVGGAAVFATAYEDSAGLVIEGLLYHSTKRKKFLRAVVTIAGGDVAFAVLIDLTREEKVYGSPQWTVAD